jgi:MFS family permease
VVTSVPLVAALVGVPAGRGVDRWGARRVALVGLAGMAAGCVALALAPVAFGIAGYVAPLVTVTAGFAIFQAANNTAVVTGVHASQRGVAAGLLNLARNLGLITGASVMGAVFALGAGTTTLAGVDAVAAGTHAAFAVAALLVACALLIARTVDR